MHRSRDELNLEKLNVTTIEYIFLYLVTLIILCLRLSQTNIFVKF